MSGALFIAALVHKYSLDKLKAEATCGDCKLIQDCSIKDMDQPACERVELWED